MILYLYTIYIMYIIHNKKYYIFGYVRLDNHIDMKHCLHPVHNNNNNNNDIWFIYHNMTLYESLYIY